MTNTCRIWPIHFICGPFFILTLYVNKSLEVCYDDEWLSHRAYKRLNKHQTFEQTELGLVFSILWSDL